MCYHILADETADLLLAGLAHRKQDMMEAFLKKERGQGKWFAQPAGSSLLILDINMLDLLSERSLASPKDGSDEKEQGAGKDEEKRGEKAEKAKGKFWGKQKAKGGEGAKSKQKAKGVVKQTEKRPAEPESSIDMAHSATDAASKGMDTDLNAATDNMETDTNPTSDFHEKSRWSMGGLTDEGLGLSKQRLNLLTLCF